MANHLCFLHLSDRPSSCRLSGGVTPYLPPPPPAASHRPWAGSAAEARGLTGAGSAEAMLARRSHEARGAHEARAGSRGARSSRGRAGSRSHITALGTGSPPRPLPLLTAAPASPPPLLPLLLIPALYLPPHNSSSAWTQARFSVSPVSFRSFNPV